MSALNNSLHRGREREASARLAAEDAKQQAEAAERRWVRFVEAAPTAFVAVDRRGGIVFVNALTERLFGYASGELIGKSVEMLVPERSRGNHEQYRAGFSDAPEMRQMGAGRDLYAVRKDGSEVPVEIGLNPIEVDDGALVMASIVDITERKRVEEALRFSEQQAKAFLDNSAIIAWLKDEQGRNVFLSDNYARRFRLTDWQNKTDFELWPRDIAETFRHNDANVLASDRPFECVEQARTPDGEASFWLNSKFWFQDAAGRKFIGGVGVDITDRKRAEDERLRLLESEHHARMEADAANRAKDLFLARVSHELRTPLNALMGWTRMLRDRSLADAKVPNALASIDRNAEVLHKLVNDLVEMSRLTTGKLQLDRKHLDVVEVVRESVHLLEPSANAKHLRMEIRSQAEPVMVDGDSTRLRQVFWNLLSNAIKFTPTDGRVVVYIKRTDGEVEISVTDTGQGIAAEFVPHVFEPFTQAESGGAGLGLGLAIVQQLVKAHDGRITVTSDGVGAGTTFRVRLPAVRVAQSV